MEAIKEEMSGLLQSQTDALLLHLRCKDGQIKLLASAFSPQYHNLLKGYNMHLSTDYKIDQILLNLIRLCQSMTPAAQGNLAPGALSGNGQGHVAGDKKVEYLSDHDLLNKESNCELSNSCKTVSGEIATRKRSNQALKGECSCPVVSCSEKFDDNDKFISHVLSHNVQMPFKCLYCQEVFLHKADVDRHVTDMHNVMITCINCLEAFADIELLVMHTCLQKGGLTARKRPSDDAESYDSEMSGMQLDDSVLIERIDSDEEDSDSRLQTEDKTVFKCAKPRCVRVFDSREELRAHTAKYGHECRDQRYRCRVCGIRFRFVGSLRRHLGCHKQVRAFACSLCVKSYETESDLRKHTETHYIDKHIHHRRDPRLGGAVPGAGDSVGQESVNDTCVESEHGAIEGKDQEEEANVSGDDCSTIDLDDSSYSFKCPKPKCVRLFLNESALQKHVKKYGHECDSNLFRCRFCGIRFTYLSSMRRHVKIHEQAKAFACRVCVKSFNNEVHLTKHIKTHFRNRQRICGEKARKKMRKKSRTFKCENHCDKTFMSRFMRDKHYRNIESREAESPVQICHVCSKMFKSIYDLNSHLICHSAERPYQCDGCSMGFARKAQLTRHFVTAHSNERNYQCDVCGKSFATQSNRTIHSATHLRPEERRRYPCPVCHKCYSKNDSLTKHMQRLHQEHT